MLSGTGQPREDNNTVRRVSRASGPRFEGGTPSTQKARATPRRPPASRRGADGSCLWFCLLLSLGVPGGFYGAMLASGNFHEVVPHRIYRSGQPSVEQLRSWIPRYGLKTVVSLRGTTAPMAAEEEAVVTSQGADMVYLSLGAHELMPREELVRLIEVLQTAKEPMLIHCYHGLDRAGTASALAAWLRGGLPYDRAKWQAYVPSGPWKRPNGSVHISDTLALYEDYCRQHGLNPDNRSSFKHWARDIYRPDDGSADPGAP
ncbi:MAG: tyrosine-protein phosphatase [Phycisphaerae bacterium]|nr:tyrosine-protein phosphatase [Phycisphaerae bacterium]